MNIPHIHATVIKAWADGAEIECFLDISKKWIPCPEPAWDSFGQYRVKPTPKTIKFRCFLQEGRVNSFTGSKHPNRICVIRNDQYTDQLELPRFIQWLGDWQGYTIEKSIIFNNPSYTTYYRPACSGTCKN